jgi:hypothetical protein
MSLKDIYYGMEDAYYETIEKISSVIPINKVTDAIDKIVPSFIVFIAIILLLVAGIVLAFTGEALREEKNLSFKIVNEKGQALSQIKVTVFFNEKTKELTTNAFGKTEKIKVPLNSLVKYEINEKKYKKESDSFKFTEEKEKIITLQEKTVKKGTKKTIKLYSKQNRNELITGKTYTVYFSCSNPEATPPATITIKDGIGEVTEPEDCGTLTAEVTGNHSETASVPLSDLTNKIYLDSLIQESTLLIEVQNNKGEELNGISIKVYKIYSNNPAPVFVDSSYTFNGQAEFQLEAGEYQIEVFDETGNYYKETESIYFTENRTLRFFLDRATPEGGSITIKVIDEDTEIELPDTTVSLYLDKELYEEKITDENGIAEFIVKDKSLLFDAVIDNEEYIIKKERGLSADNKAYTIGLEKFTGENGGKLKVKAITIENGEEKPVRNARIALYSVEGNEISLTGIKEKVTDENGLVEFTKIKNGRYKAFAYKGTSSGWSDEVLYDMRRADEIELIATMIIAEGTLKLKIVDEESNAIPFATVTFFEEGLGKLKAEKSDANGAIEFQTKADKKVYFKVEKEGFLDYYSVSYPIFGETTTEETITMTPTKRMDKPEIKLTGLFRDERQVEALSLEPGGEYTAKIQLIIPKGKNYGKAGIHFRTGNDIFMENDYIFIKKVNAPKAVTTKYTMFDKDNLRDTKKSYTQGNAKWFNSVWLLPKAGVYNIHVLVKVRENALPGQELKLRYRAYGMNGRTERDPVDVSVTSSKELNAATKEKTYTVGTNVLCSDEFCFSATITDLEEDLIKSVTDSYTTKILQKYELQFDVLNNSKIKKHYNARIQLKNENEMLNFLDYKIRNADALTRSGIADTSKTPWIELGDFNPNTHINGRIKFITQETKTGTIKIQIVSSQEIAFEKEIEIKVEAKKAFRIEFNPKEIPATTRNLVEFTVFDKDTNIEVEKAQIKVFDRFNDLIAGPKLTNKTGKIQLSIPAQAPDTMLTIKVEKKGYQPLKETLSVSGKVVEISPQRIGIALNTQTKQTDTFALKIKNLLDFDLELVSLKFTGNFRHLLNEKAMNAWMHTNYGNIKIPSKITKEIEVKAILSDYALERKERDFVELTLELEFSNGEGHWSEEIPARISIGIGGEVDNPYCLTVERKEWKTSTEGSKVKIDFGIENSCTINGQPIELRDLEAKVNWNSNHIGTYTLTFEDNPVELRSAYYKKISNLIENRKYTATLSFEPNGGVNGTANAEITIKARNQLDGKDEFIEDKIQTEIKIVNLKDCIKFSNTELKIKAGESASFTVSTLDCGSNVNFTFDSELKLNTKSITLSSQETSPEITVNSEGAYPGRYIIKAQAKGNSLATKTQMQNIYVTVYDDSCVELSRYEFDIYDSPETEFDGYDTAQLFNHCSEKTVNVTIDMQDWSLAMRKAILPAVMAFGLSVSSPEKNNTQEYKATKIEGKIEKLKKENEKLRKKIEGREEDKELFEEKKKELLEEISSNEKQIKELQQELSDTKKQSNDLLSMFARSIIPEPIEEEEYTEMEDVEIEYVGETDIGSEESTDSQNETTETSDKKEEGSDSQTENTGVSDTGDVETDSSEPIEIAGKEIFTKTGFISIPGIGQISQILGLDNILGTVLGTDNPFATFGLVFAGATLYNYFSAEEMQFDAIADDITVDDIKLLDGIKYTTEKIEVLDEDITLIVEGPFTCFDSFSNETIECYDLVFVNEKGLLQENEETPIMKILKTESSEHFWRTDYDLDYFNKNKGFFEKFLKGADLDLEKGLEELTNKRNEIIQYNRLQFNSWNPKDSVEGKQDAYTSCSIGELSGITGENAVPRIKLEWKWSAIPENACDEENPKYIYCDATQFSIELLQKINELTELLERESLLCEGNCTTSNLPELIQKTEEAGRTVNNKERLMQLVSFNSFLIKDGYSKDFQEDFHDYAVNTAFFDAPSYYYKEDGTGIGTYFKDNSLFEFDYAGSPNAPLQGPGLYTVKIEISFNDNSWDLFKGRKPNAKIKVKLNKLRAAKPNSPLYYLPFNGEIGIFSSNGRVGYGLDYENIKGEPIKINEGIKSIRTVPLSVADPTEKLNTYYETSFKKSNIDERAKIMQFERTSTGTKLIYTPSKATPVLLEVTRSKEKPKDYAYAFYSITVDGQAQNTGSRGITKWSGIEANCKDFEDRSSLDYMETFDLHGLSEEASYAQITQNKATAYGFVWRNPIRTGKFWLETIIFTPLNAQTRMHLISASNTAKLYTPTQTATLSENQNIAQFVELKGVTSLEITSLQKIIDLVKTEKVCVGGTGNSSYAYFFWNPEKVDDYIEPVKNSLNVKENCITE